jgi:hypothetical protein
MLNTFCTLWNRAHLHIFWKKGGVRHDGNDGKNKKMPGVLRRDGQKQQMLPEPVRRALPPETEGRKSPSLRAAPSQRTPRFREITSHERWGEISWKKFLENGVFNRFPGRNFLKTAFSTDFLEEIS